MSLHPHSPDLTQRALWVLLVHANSLLASLNARNSLRGHGLGASGVPDTGVVAPMFPIKKVVLYSSLRDREMSY